ncbi:MAG: hypothetical protein JEZ03_01025 [Bacteroidales bacterium]|nr:hypothetical protein [Bacteroidales bacterium]
MENKTTIIGIRIDERSTEAIKVQEILTKYGCSIKTRLGLSDFDDDSCQMSGIILLELSSHTMELEHLETELKKIDHISVEKMML